MRCYLISGEASGDLHAGNLIKSWKKINPQLDCRAWGGQQLREAGAKVVKDYKDIAFMGFFEVLKHIRTISKLFRFCKKDILTYKPEVLILVDYPGFNLRMAKWASKHQIQVFYFISPQIWAWKENRIKQIKTYVNEMFVILPFEQAFYQKHQYNVHFEGHPLPEIIDRFEVSNPYQFEKSVLALVPGSRKQEIHKNLPIMLSVFHQFKDQFQFVVACAPGIDQEIYKSYTGHYPEIYLEKGGSYELLSQADIALVSSGTATLETALFNLPQIVCYRTSKISYHIARALIKVKYISLVNLILDKAAIVELVQNNFNSNNLIFQIKQHINREKRNKVKHEYSELRNLLGKEGVYNRLARKMQDLLKN